MRTTLVSLIAVSLTCLYAVAAELPVTDSPRHKARVACFNGKADSGSSCSVTNFQPDGVIFASGKMSCGWPGQVSELEWSFVERRNDKDVYQFTRRFPSETAATTTTIKIVEFSNSRVVVFEDNFQAVVMDPAHPLAGTWVNVDENTDSITRLEVKEEADGWTIQAWGKCVPTDCDWGAVPLHMAVAYADAPHSRCEKIEVPGEKTVTRCIYDPLDIAKFKHGVAHWNHKDLGIQVFMTLQVANGELVVETVDVFDKKMTGQTNMLIKDSFRKAERVPAEPVAESAGR